MEHHLNKCKCIDGFFQSTAKTPFYRHFQAFYGHFKKTFINFLKKNDIMLKYKSCQL